MDNANSREYLDKILIQVLENMRRTAHAPSVQHIDVPRESLGMNDDDEAALDDFDEDMNADNRTSQRKSDKYVEKNGELSDSDDDDEVGAPSRLPGRDMRRARMNYRNLLDVGADSGVETGSGVGTPLQGTSLPDEDDEALSGSPASQASGMSINNAPSSEADHAMPGNGVEGAAPEPDGGDVEMGDASDAPAPPPPVTYPAVAPEPTAASGQITPPDSPPAQPTVAASGDAPATNGELPVDEAGTETEAGHVNTETAETSIKAEEDSKMDVDMAKVDGEPKDDTAGIEEEL
jgi:histone deacetylase 1/2